MHPPFSFRSCRKENGPCTVQKKRTPFVALRHLRASALYGGRREMVPACSRWPPDGRGGMRWELERGFPRRGCGGYRGARTHLTSSSFRAFRFATRSPGGRGGLHQLPSTAKPAAAKREAIQCDDHPDEVGTIRHGTAVTKIAEESSVPDGQLKSALAPIRRPPSRAEGHCTGARPSGLFFWTVHGPFSFPQDGKENGGCIPLDQPPAGAETRWPPSGGPYHLSPAGRCVPADSR